MGQNNRITEVGTNTLLRSVVLNGSLAMLDVSVCEVLICIEEDCADSCGVQKNHITEESARD